MNVTCAVTGFGESSGRRDAIATPLPNKCARQALQSSCSLFISVACTQSYSRFSSRTWSCRRQRRGAPARSLARSGDHDARLRHPRTVIAETAASGVIDDHVAVARRSALTTCRQFSRSCARSPTCRTSRPSGAFGRARTGAGGRLYGPLRAELGATAPLAIAPASARCSMPSRS